MIIKWKIFELKEINVQDNFDMMGNSIVAMFDCWQGVGFESEEEALLFLSEHFEDDETITYENQFVIKKIVRKS